MALETERVVFHRELRPPRVGIVAIQTRDACLAAGANRVDTKPRRFAEQVALAREWAALLRLPTPPSETRADHDRT